MSTPNRIDLSPEQLEALIDRLDRECLMKEDYRLLIDVVKALVWMNFALQEKQLSIQRLRAIFGIKTETAQRLLELAGILL